MATRCMLGGQFVMCLQAIDAAKKKAVSQHVDYDTFKNMVRQDLGRRQQLS